MREMDKNIRNRKIEVDKKIGRKNENRSRETKKQRERKRER